MRQKKFILSSLLFTFTISSFAATPSFFLGAGIGQATGPDDVAVYNGFSGNDGSITGANSDVYNFSNRGALFLNILAGYNFNHFFGAEIFSSYLGSQNLSAFAGGITKSVGINGNLKSFAYGLNAIGYLPIEATKFEFFGKVGFAYLHSRVTVNDPDGLIYVNAGTYKTTTNQPAYNLALGVEYHYTPRLAGKVEWNKITRFNDVSIGNLNYNNIQVGIIYSFNA